MQFKHPEILYALLLLLIPIFIHLFQLRRFQKIDFTNVAFLRKVTQQTRKSSTLKKWLVLLLRCLAIACIVIAFAQPFSADNNSQNIEKETVIYLDNSFSMEAKGANGALFERAKQQLYQQLQGEAELSWFTNTSSKLNTTFNEFRDEVLSLDYSYKSLSPNEVLLKAAQFFSDKPNVGKELLWISDFQNGTISLENTSNIDLNLVQLKAIQERNIALDSVYIQEANGTSLQLGVRLTAYGSSEESTTLSLLNNENLIAKSGVDFSDGNTQLVNFNIDVTDGFQGILRITDSNLSYDNQLFFNINPSAAIKVLSINNTNANFLQRLFDQDGYRYQQQQISNLDYSLIPDQHFIVLNELDVITGPLEQALLAFVQGGGSLCIIPAAEIDRSSYNSFLRKLSMGGFDESIEVEKKIANINFDHPLFQNVFEKEVQNFQYPSTQSYFPYSGSGVAVLQFEDRSEFLVATEQIYLWTGAFSGENTNFKNSPLIVPTFLRMAQQSLPLPSIYYQIGEANRFSVPIQLKNDEILAIRDSIDRFIPLQQNNANSVVINLSDEIQRQGGYELVQGERILQNISFNYARNESELTSTDTSNWPAIQRSNTVSEMFLQLDESNKVSWFWKWFVIFAISFLLAEMIILKFYK